MHRVPSAITYLVQELESALGVALFDRSGRRARLTDAGERILEAGRDVLERGRMLENLASELVGGWEAELHVVRDAALPLEPLTECLVRFAQPDVPTRLRVDTECQEGVLDRFESAKADLALYLGFDSDVEAAKYHTIPLPVVDFVLVAAAEHPLTDADGPDARSSRWAELIVQDSALRFRERSKPSFMGSHNVVYHSDFHSKRFALLAGAGFGWIPAHLVQEELASGQLVLLSDKPNRWTYSPVVVSRRGQTLGRGARLFLERLMGE